MNFSASTCSTPPTERLGTVVDVRLTVDGDLDDNPDSPTLFGLVVSPRTRSSYLGYERSDARRPAVLAALLRWRHRGTFLALWDDIGRSTRIGDRFGPDFSATHRRLRDDD